MSGPPWSTALRKRFSNAWRSRLGSAITPSISSVTVSVASGALTELHAFSASVVTETDSVSPIVSPRLANTSRSSMSVSMRVIARSIASYLDCGTSPSIMSR